MCTYSWVFRSPRTLNVFGQCEHLWDFSPVCVRLWIFNWPFILKPFLQWELALLQCEISHDHFCDRVVKMIDCSRCTQIWCCYEYFGELLMKAIANKIWGICHSEMTCLQCEFVREFLGVHLEQMSSCIVCMQKVSPWYEFAKCAKLVWQKGHTYCFWFEWTFICLLWSDLRLKPCPQTKQSNRFCPVWTFWWTLRWSFRVNFLSQSSQL